MSAAYNVCAIEVQFASDIDRLLDLREIFTEDCDTGVITKRELVDLLMAIDDKLEELRE